MINPVKSFLTHGWGLNSINTICVRLYSPLSPEFAKEQSNGDANLTPPLINVK